MDVRCRTSILELMTKRKSKASIVLFGVFALISCTIACLTFGVGPAPLENDAAQYWTLAGDVSGGDWLQLRNEVDYRTPLYPAILGVYRYLFDANALMAVVISQHILVLLTNLLIAFICWRVTHSRMAALACYAICALSLMRPWFANLICPETLFAFLFIGSFGALCAYHQRPGLGRAMAFGALMALTILVRPVPKLLWIPLLGVFLMHATTWVAAKQHPRVVIGHALAAAMVLMMIMSPWWARNWALFGSPFVARLPAVNKWQVCFQGGSAARLAIPNTASGQRLLELLGARNGDVPDRYCAAVIKTLESKGLSNDEIDELVSTACGEAIKDQPLQFAWPTFKRFVNFWRCRADGIPFCKTSEDAQYYGQNTWEFGAVADRYQSVLRNSPAHWLRWNDVWTVLLGAGTMLMIRSRSMRLIGISSALIFLYFAAVTSVVEVENYKYRVFLEPLMIAAVVGGCVAFWDSTKTSPPESTDQATKDTVPYGYPLRKLLVESGHLRQNDEYSEAVNERAFSPLPPGEVASSRAGEGARRRNEDAVGIQIRAPSPGGSLPPLPEGEVSHTQHFNFEHDKQQNTV
jgi:hypothetical protein